ncbi:MAG: RNA polymerase sigma factor [Bacteroidales bacterium]
METESDEYYLNKIMNGESQAYSHIVEKYKDMVYRICLKVSKQPHLAEEAAQDTFLKAFNNIENFRMESQFSTWIYRIAYNTSISAVRKKKIEFCPMNEQITENYSVEEINTDIKGMDRKEVKDKLKEIISSLPEQDRALVHLFYMEKTSVEEISEITELSKSNIKVKLHRLRKKMFNELNAYIKSKATKLCFF